MAIISSSAAAAAATLSLSYTPIKPISSVSTAKIQTLCASSSSSLFNNCNKALFARISTSKLVSKNGKKRGLSCNCMFGLGVPELVVIAGVAALVFGPKQLPEVGRSIGKTVKSFQQAAKEFETELKKEPEASPEPPVEKAIAVSQEEKQDAEVSSTKQSS